jgi:hypothetical protein
MAEPRGVDHYDATFARDLAWAQALHKQLAELPATDEPDRPDDGNQRGT